VSRDNFNWLGAYGALLTMFTALVFFTRYTFPELEKELRLPVQKQAGAWVNISGLTAECVTEEQATSLNNKHLLSINDKYRDIFRLEIITLIGTLLWAYSGFIELTKVKSFICS
jgi:hypothetical protein